MDGQSTYWLDIRNYHRRIPRVSVLFGYQEKREKKKREKNEIDSIGALKNMDEERQSLSLIVV